MIEQTKILELIKPECVSCNFNKRTRCNNCNFVKGHNLQTGKTFKKIGIPIGLEKSKLFYYLYHSELNWKLPNIPEYDFIGNHKSTRQFHWVLHHEDCNHFNDNEWNLILCLNTEHKYFHNLENHPMKNIHTRQKISKTNSIISNQKIKNGTHNFITNHPMKNPEIKQRRLESLLRTINEGKIKDRAYSLQQTKLLLLLNNLEQGIYKISDISIMLNIKTFLDNSYLKKSISILIEREKLEELSIFDNNRQGGQKRWFIKKL